MTVLEVYAANIQPRQIVERLKCDPASTDVIEDERANFLSFLTEQEEQGVVYPNQVWAWNEYDAEMYYEREAEELDAGLLILQEADAWETELDILWKRRNPRNYNEYGGQQ